MVASMLLQCDPHFLQIFRIKITDIMINKHYKSVFGNEVKFWNKASQSAIRFNLLLTELFNVGEWGE